MSNHIFEYIASRLNDVAATASEVRSLVEAQKERTEVIAEALRSIASSIEEHQGHLGVLAEIAEEAQRNESRNVAVEQALFNLMWLLDNDDELDFFEKLHAVLKSIDGDGLSVRDVSGVESKQRWIETMVLRASSVGSRQLGRRRPGPMKWLVGWVCPIGGSSLAIAIVRGRIGFLKACLLPPTDIRSR